MIGIPLYSRFLDEKGRLFICIGRTAKYENEELIASTLMMLEVEEEKVHVSEHDKVMSWIEKGKLKQIIKAG